MNTTIKTGLAALLVLAVTSCRKESNTIPSSRVTASSTADVITDIAGKYPSVLIGTQKWMTKNLDVTHYRNGDKIPQVKDAGQWNTLITGAWCWYNNDSATGAVYGRLYNWYAVHDPRGLAPTGWHIPSDPECVTFAVHLGDNAGGKLKDTGTVEAGTGLWYAPNTGATNKTGFTGLPGGFRDYLDGGFYGIGRNGYWWSSTDNTGYPVFRLLYYKDGTLGRYINYKQDGMSVRCIKD